jgi:hypothetical protein
MKVASIINKLIELWRKSKHPAGKIYLKLLALLPVDVVTKDRTAGGFLS